MVSSFEFLRGIIFYFIISYFILFRSSNIYIRANNFYSLVFVLVVSKIVVNVHINSLHTNLTEITLCDLRLRLSIDLDKQKDKLRHESSV